jgi:hypothetical protein
MPGSTAAIPYETSRALAARPRLSAQVSSASTIAAAASFSPGAFPAVMAPFGRNAGFNRASASSVVSGRLPSSLLGRNILPIEREGLISVAPGRADRRSKELRLTEVGIERLRAARAGWSEAQAGFAAAFGDERAAGLRALLREVSATNLPAVSGVTR